MTSPNASVSRVSHGSASPGLNATSTSNSLFDSKQHTIDVLTLELNGARASAKRSQEEVALLRHQLGVVRGQLSGVGTRGAGAGLNSRPPVEEAWIIFSRSVLAMERAGASDAQQPQHASPNSTILRSLHQGQDIEVPAECDYIQLSALAEACRQAQPHIRRLTLDLHEGSHAPFVNAAVTSLASLQELRCSRVNDTSMASVLAPAISAHPELEVLELPQLAISDQGALQLRKALSERRVLAEAGAASFLRPMTLDFSGCYFKEPDKFAMFGGDAETLILDNQRFFTFPEIRSSLESCAASPWLTSVSVAGTMVDNRICALLNESFPQVVELNLVDCANITHINLKHVTHLHTDGRRIVEFCCPNLEVMATPLTHFAPAVVDLPKLDDISFLNATLTKREMELLGVKCGKSLTVVKFLGCRLESLETLMRQLRRLEVFSVHSSKGVRDVDLKILFEPLADVDLTDNFVLTDAVLESLARCPNLERLSLKRCQNVTDVGIAKLEGHPSLAYLNLLGVKKVSAAAVQRLVRVSSQNAQRALLLSQDHQQPQVQSVDGNSNANEFSGEVVPPTSPAATDRQQQQQQQQQRELLGLSSSSSASHPSPSSTRTTSLLTSVIDVRHATAVSTEAMIERDDEEEKERRRIGADERTLERRKRTLAAFACTYDGKVGSPSSAFRMKPSASPRFTPSASSRGGNGLSTASTLASASQQTQHHQNGNHHSNPALNVAGARPGTRDQGRDERNVINFVPGTEL